MLINWTDEERESCKRRDVNIFILNTAPEDIAEMDAELPTDTHLIEYIVDGETTYDAIRAYKKSNIFDEYWDKYRHDFKNMTQTEGRVNPKLWGNSESSKKKK